VDFGRRALAALGKVGIVLAVLAAFLFGLMGTVYLSLRTGEVKVPDVLGKDRLSAEAMLEDMGLKIRVRGTRPSAEKPDTILSQLPEAGQVVKVGIPVAVEISRAPKEGESVPTRTEETPQQPEKPAENANANQAPSATNQNQNQNQNKPPKNKNTNKNANNANNSNNANRNSNANRNANDRNANTTRNTNNGNRNANTTPNANRTTNNSNTIRRPPVITTPPFNPGANRGTP
jgi:beta-lactam-binding protein with PASTA domain